MTAVAAGGRPRRFVPFELGFRPFFLMAGVAATMLVPAWLLAFNGMIDPAGEIAPSLWHGHEMVFGYAAAVMAGFLLTAVSNWTGRVTARGGALAALAGLWLAGRVIMIGGIAPTWLAAAVDVAFLPVLAAVLWRALAAGGNDRNMPFPVILLALASLNLAFHLAAAGAIDWAPGRSLRVALDLIVVMMVVIGGRVIPMFTRNAVPAAPVRAVPWLDKASIILAAAVAAANLVFGDGPPTALLALAAGLANAARLAGWSGLASRGRPILWVLHVGYLWIPFAFLLRAAGELGVPADAGLHAVAAGAIGTLTLAMMTRVALGHTGRPLVAPAAIVAAYGLVILAAALRVALPFTAGEAFEAVVLVSGAAWTTAFALFTAVYAPILVRPRVDSA